MQYELDLRDWRAMSSAPKNAKWVEVDNGVATIRAHFAEDLSGEDQPAFSGWFYAVKDEKDRTLYFAAVHPKPKRWRPEQ